MNILFYFLLPFFINIILLPLLIYVSEKTRGIVDISEGDILKIHKRPTSLLGGLGIAVSLFFGLLLFGPMSQLSKTAAIFLGFSIIFLVMFWDDLKWKHISNIRPLFKFPILILSALIPTMILSLQGIAFNFIPFCVPAIILGTIFIFTVINSINYQDGMDGLAGGQVFISLIGFIVLSLLTQNIFTLIISLIIAGAVMGFLVFNLPPAKVFMGDSGAYSLGFLLAVIAFMFSKPYGLLSVIGPIFIIGLPVFDGIFTNIRRLANGKSILLGDRSHFYDRLLQKGLSTQKTLAICYGWQIVLVVMGVLIYQ